YLLVFSVSDHLVLLSFPTRRSSDLGGIGAAVEFLRRGMRRYIDQNFSHDNGALLKALVVGDMGGISKELPPMSPTTSAFKRAPLDRKSTRLNSSHVAKSYAVFCSKK